MFSIVKIIAIESSYVIGTVYHHPSTIITNSCVYLNETFVERNMQIKYYFVLGDIDINTKMTNLNSLHFIIMLSSNCSISIIGIPTRVTSTFATVFLITSSPMKIVMLFAL